MLHMVRVRGRPPFRAYLLEMGIFEWGDTRGEQNASAWDQLVDDRPGLWAPANENICFLFVHSLTSKGVVYT